MLETFIPQSSVWPYNPHTLIALSGPQKIKLQIDTTVDPDQIKSIGPRRSKAWQTEPEIVRRWTRPPSAGLPTDEWDDSLDGNAAGRWETRQARRRDNQLQGRSEECCQVHRRRGTDSCESGGANELCTCKLFMDRAEKERISLLLVNSPIQAPNRSRESNLV